MFSSRVRRSDTVARTGGDEFSIVLEEPTSRAEAMQVGRSLMQILNEPLEVGEQIVCIGDSVGIAVYPEDGREMESLCIAADLRMYDAKNDSRNLRKPEPPGSARVFAGTESHAQMDLQVVD